MIVTSIKLDKFFFSFLMIFALFFPTFSNVLESAGAILVNAGLILFISLYLFFTKDDVFSFFFTSPLAFKIYSLIFIFFLVHLSASILIGVFAGGINLSFRDFFEFHRPVLYFLCFYIGYRISRADNFIGFYKRLLIFIFIITAVIGFNQFFRGIDAISYLFTKSLNVATRRVSAPFPNPYDFAFFITFFIYYFLLQALFLNRKYFFFFLIATILLVLPQSRSVVGGFLVGFFGIMPISFLVSEVNYKAGTISIQFMIYYSLYLLLLLLLASLIPFLLDNFGYLTNQFVRLLQGEGLGNSGNIRVEQFMFALEKAKNPLIFLFGNGPAKSEMEYVESIYNYQFYRYGIVGLVFYFILPLTIAINYSIKLVGIFHKSPKIKTLFFAAALWLLTSPIMMIGNNFSEQVRMSFFFYSLMGIIIGYYQKHNSSALSLREQEK